MLRRLVSQIGGELGDQFRRLGGEIGVNLGLCGHAGFDRVGVVHGPPVMVLEPVAGAEMVHVDDPLADDLVVGVQGVHLDEQIALGFDGRGAIANQSGGGFGNKLGGSDLLHNCKSLHY